MIRLPKRLNGIIIPLCTVYIKLERGEYVEDSRSTNAKRNLEIWRNRVDLSTGCTRTDEPIPSATMEK